jgi:hypothetical protein
MNCCRKTDDGPRSALLSSAFKKNPGIGLRRYFYTNMLRMSGITIVSDTPSLCRSLLASTTENVSTFMISPHTWTHALLQSLISYHLNVKGKLQFHASTMFHIFEDL